MNYFITGGTGYVGTVLCRSLLENENNSITAVGRSGSHPLQTEKNFTYVSADTTVEGIWQNHVPKADIIINLAGVNIFRFWTKKNKRQIHDSRILTTRHIVNTIDADRGTTLLNTSAAGYYGNRGDQELHENDQPGKDFLATVCVDWENEALKAKTRNARVILMRFGVVIGKNGGALSKMSIPFKLFMILL